MQTIKLIIVIEVKYEDSIPYFTNEFKEDMEFHLREGEKIKKYEVEQ